MLKKCKKIVPYLFILFLLTTLHKVSAQSRWRDRILERRRQRAEQANTTIPAPGDSDFMLQWQGAERKYLVHVPPGYNAQTPAPLVVAFHGGLGDYERFADDGIFHLKSKSDQEGFIIVFPNGTSRSPSGKFATWNAGDCCGYAQDNNVDDFGFVKAMIDQIKQNYVIDTNRIFAIGFSNGGMLCYRLVCEMTAQFKAIASVAGTENFAPCTPQKSISILHIHAKNDDHVLFDGGCGPQCRVDAETEFTSVPETVWRWAQRNNCNKNPKGVVDRPGAHCDVYDGCDNNSRVMLCVTEDGGHSWPGATVSGTSDIAPSRALSAVDEMWEFFKNLPE